MGQSTSCVQIKWYVRLFQHLSGEAKPNLLTGTAVRQSTICDFLGLVTLLSGSSNINT